MLDFMVIALPRSGTTWAANWLTGDRTFCVHDPLWTLHYTDLDRLIPARAGARLSGVSCTALWRWPRWLNRHPARKLILHRDVREVNESMTAAGLPPLPAEASKCLSRLEGEHVPWTDLFDADRATALWCWLAGGLPFDAERHAELTQLDICPHPDAVKRDLDLNLRLGEELGVRPLQSAAPLEIRFGG